MMESSLTPEIETPALAALSAQLEAIRGELAELKRSAVVTNSLGAIYHQFRLAFFDNQPEPLAFPKVDFLIFSLLAGGIKYSSYDAANKRLVLAKDGVLFATDAYFYILLEVFGKEEYRVLRSLVDRPFVVYDLGMNRGYASLWFANQPLCRKVYGFELFEAPYRWAQHNFALNPHLAAKIEPFCIGLGAENTTTDVFFENASDGVTTVMPEFFDEFWSDKRKTNHRKQTVSLRKASEVIGALPPCGAGECRVLKIDVEGAEYGIVAELAQAGRLDFDIILAETHLGLDAFLALTPGYRVVEVMRHKKNLANVALVRA